MESAAVAKIAEKTNLSFLSLRIVLDETNHSLRIGPSGISRNGQIVLSKVVKVLLMTPQLIPDFIKIRAAWKISEGVIQSTLLAVVDGVCEDVI